MASRRFAVLGACVVATVAGIAIWILGLRELTPISPPDLRAPAVSTPSVDPPPETSAPVVARRTKKAPEPYLPPYQKPPHLLTEPVRAVLVDAEEIRKWPKLFGRVVSAVDQAPLRDAVVGVANEFTSGREFRESVLMVDDVRAVARADGDGRFEIDEPVAGAVFLATAPGFGPVLFDRDWLGRTHEAPFVIVLAPSATFRARVTDRVGAPKSKVEIRLIAAAYEATQRRDLPHHRILSLLVGARRVTDDGGQATFAGLSPDVPFAIELWSGRSRLRRDFEEIVFEPGQEISKEWRLGSGSTVRGRVVDDADRAVAGQSLLFTQRVLATSQSAVRAALQWDDENEASHDLLTDSDGRFSIEDVGPGKWWLGIAPSKLDLLGTKHVDFEALAPVAVTFVVEPDRDPSELILRAHRGLYIRGTTLDPEGLPVLASLIAFSTTENSSFVASASADAATGEFAIGPLEPGEYRVEARPFPVGEFRKSGAATGLPLAPIDPLLVLAGREDLVITFGLGGSIGAAARRADTGASVAASFWLAPAVNPERCQITGFGDPLDTTSFKNLKTGTYSISAVTPDGRVGCVRDILVGNGQRIDDVDVRVEPGAHLKLTYVGNVEEYAQVMILGGSTVFGADGIQKGTSAIFVAPVGKVTVRWRAGSERVEEELELAVDETRELSWPRPR